MLGFSQALVAQSPHDFEATAWLTSNYVFRGITNSDNGPAIQAEIDYSYEPLGLYAFVWASNIDLADVDTDVEIDYGLGFSGELTEQMGWDIGAIYYHYPGAGDNPKFDYVEAYSELNYAFNNIALAPYLAMRFWYSPDFFGEDGAAAYLEGKIELTLPEDFILTGHAGYQGVSGDKFSGSAGYDYFDFSVSLKRHLFGFDWDLSYTNTINQVDACGRTSDCDHQVIFTVSRTLN